MEQWIAISVANFNNCSIKKQTILVVFIERRDKGSFPSLWKSITYNFYFGITGIVIYRGDIGPSLVLRRRSCLKLTFFCQWNEGF